MSLEDKITGTAKEAEGKLTGDKSREAEGKLERARARPRTRPSTSRTRLETCSIVRARRSASIAPTRSRRPRIAADRRLAL
jgi:hypothetical protein